MSNVPKGWVEFQVIDEIHNPKGWWCIDITKEPIVCVEDYTNSAGCHVRTVKDGRRVNETRTEVLNAVSQAQQDVVIRDGYSQVQGTQPESVTTYYPDIKEEIKKARLELLDKISEHGKSLHGAALWYRTAYSQFLNELRKQGGAK